MTVDRIMALDRSGVAAARQRGVGIALDRASVRTFDKDGRLHVKTAHISKATVNPYRGSEIPNAEALGLDDAKTYRLLRDPRELAKAAATFNNLPILNKHVPVTAEAPRGDLVIGSTGTDAAFDAPYLDNSLVFWTQDAIDEIESDERRELSCAYHYVPVVESGTYEGQPYDIRMTEIVGNHVALVKSGRAGDDVVVGDEKPASFVGGTDEFLFNPKDNPMAKGSQALSRKADIVRGALAAYLAPKLAQDAKIDLRTVLLGTTARNYVTSKPVIAARLVEATKGKLAKDANLSDVHGLLDRLDGEGAGDDDTPKDLRTAEMDPEEMTDNPAVDDDNPGMAICKFLEGKVAPELLAEIRKMAEAKAMDDADWIPSDAEMEGKSPEERAKMMREAKDKHARDMAAKDKAAKDAANMLTAESQMKKAEEAKDKAAKDKKAMDAAIEAALTGERQRSQDLREAEKFVRPWIGELTMAQDTAEQVYRLALDSLNIDVKGVHPSAYRAVLQAQPKPGEARRSDPARIAADSAASADLAKREPNFGRLKRTVA